ncbi:MAG: C_GCAxxG_C_C family protein [Desulfobacterales bacterium]|nr:C_GCAxxG_C_C family protein [Desulfobacterales bacterium]
MFSRDEITKKIKDCYWVYDLNCATTNLKILAEQFKFGLSNQAIDAALGMHGAGGYGAQCGLVEGTLMFAGIYGRHLKINDNDIILLCNNYAEKFEMKFKSLQCKDLRPNGFREDDPPHLCESFTCDAICFNSLVIKDFFNIM